MTLIPRTALCCWCQHQSVQALLAGHCICDNCWDQGEDAYEPNCCGNC